MLADAKSGYKILARCLNELVDVIAKGCVSVTGALISVSSGISGSEESNVRFYSSFTDLVDKGCVLRVFNITLGNGEAEAIEMRKRRT